MSDVNLAPAPVSGAPEPAPATESLSSSSSGVPINPNPISPPSPVDNRPPEKEPRHRPSRLETIEAAFKKSEASRPKPKAAEAKMGHNQPPEAMEEEEKFDLRRRPKDQPREKGKFVAREPQAPDGSQQNVPGSPQVSGTSAAGSPQVRGPQLPEHAPYRAPPPRMHQQAQAEWHAAPESVRGEVYRMAKEFNDAYQRSNADVQEMNQIRHFQNMARQHGTSLQKALQNYTGMEQLLRTDLVAGLDLIVNNMKLRSPDGQQLGIRDVAYHILNQTPEQHRLLQSQNTQMAQSHQLAQIQQRQAALEQREQQMYAQQRFIHSRSAVDQFAANLPRFDELSDIIYQEVTTGHPLDVAYRRAELLRPTQAAQTRTPSAQTRPADRSISGAPDGSTMNGASRAKKPVPSIHDAVTNAVRQVRGAM